MVAVVVAVFLCISLLLSPQLAHSDTGPAHAGETRCLALTLYWEARGGGHDAMVAVGWVVLNRQKNASFPDTVCAVVRDGGEKAPCQFSYWCDGEPDVPRQNQSWNLANKIAAEMLTDPPADPTRGALYYHSTDTSPSWADAHRRTAKVGQLIFYR